MPKAASVTVMWVVKVAEFALAVVWTSMIVK